MTTQLTKISWKSLTLLVFFGTLIGLNETITGSYSFPYRSSVLSAVAIAILIIARNKGQLKGSSLFVMLIAILFKLNNLGFHSCTSNVLLCGPSALLLLGLSFEIFATFTGSFIKNRFLSTVILCFMSALLAFTLFGFMNTFILHSWDTARLQQYIMLKGTMAGLFSAILCLPVLFGLTFFNKQKQLHFPFSSISVAGILSIGFWVIGSLIQF